MSERLFESVQTHMGMDAEPHPEKASPDTPFRILFVGDFSGRANRGLADAQRIAQARPQLIDRDNAEVVMRKWGAELQLRPLGEDSQPITIKLASLDDFHPDNLYENVNIFKDLRDIRRKLSDPKTFAQAKAEVSSWTGTPAPAASTVASTPCNTSASTAPGDGAALLDQMMGGAAPAPTPVVSNERGWNALLRELVAPHVIPAADPRQAELTGYVDTALSVLMRAVLHDPHFQALEAAWRALDMAVHDIDTDTQLKLYVIDAGKAEFAAAFEGDPQSGDWHRLLVDDVAETFGDEGWALVAANYTIGDSTEDMALLNNAAEVAKASGAPFVAAANSKLLGCTSLAKTPRPDDWRTAIDCSETWTKLRATPQARYISLAAPRLLLRLPYGKATDAVERFAFEEIDDSWQHENYVWGSPAIACAVLLARTFSAAGWDFSAGIERDIDGLPLHVHKQNGESVTKPCAEIALSERAATRMLECGVMPFASIKDEDRVRLVRLQSIAENGGALLGRWG